MANLPWRQQESDVLSKSKEAVWQDRNRKKLLDKIFFQIRSIFHDRLGKHVKQQLLRDGLLQEKLPKM